VSYDEHVFRDARTALRAVRAGCPVRVGPLVLAEMEEFDRRCPYYCDGSQHGVAAYLEGLVARTGLSLERVSYAWRTTPSLLRFLAALSAEAGNVARCAICGWRIDDTGDHAPQPDPLGLLGDVCVWCWRTRADRRPRGLRSARRDDLARRLLRSVGDWPQRAVHRPPPPPPPPRDDRV
jgi:hypothetical protein